MRKGIGPNNLGAPKGVGKMMGSPAKQVSQKEMDYIVADNAKKDIKRAETEEMEDSYAANREVTYNTGRLWNAAKKRAAQRRIDSYGFPKSVSDK
jgi:hypothetical protein